MLSIVAIGLLLYTFKLNCPITLFTHPKSLLKKYSRFSSFSPGEHIPRVFENPICHLIVLQLILSSESSHPTNKHCRPITTRTEIMAPEYQAGASNRPNCLHKSGSLDKIKVRTISTGFLINEELVLKLKAA